MPSSGSSGSADTPRLSIITPSYNQAAYLEETILSVQGQAHAGIEHIVVDGGSTDGSVEVIRRHASKLASWVSEPDRGQSHAINKGLEKATGELVAYLNSDDVYLPGAFDAAFETMHAGVSWAAGGVLGFGGPGMPVGEWHMAAPPRSLAQCLSGQFIAAQPGHFWRRELFQRHGGFDESFRYLFDIEWYARLLAAGEHCVVIPRPLAGYRFHETSKSVSEGDKFETEWERIRARYVGKVPLLEQPWVRHKLGLRRANVAFGRALRAAANGAPHEAWSIYRSAVLAYPPAAATRAGVGAVRRLLRSPRP